MSLDYIPNPIDTELLRLSRRHNNGGRRERCSLDPARRGWYARHRTRRLRQRG